VGRGYLTLTDLLGAVGAALVLIVHHVLAERRVRRVTEAIDRLTSALERRGSDP